jgi:hypothetical protein
LPEEGIDGDCESEADKCSGQSSWDYSPSEECPPRIVRNCLCKQIQAMSSNQKAQLGAKDDSGDSQKIKGQSCSFDLGRRIKSRLREQIAKSEGARHKMSDTYEKKEGRVKRTHAKSEHVRQCAGGIVEDMELAGLEQDEPRRHAFTKCLSYSQSIDNE